MRYSIHQLDATTWELRDSAGKSVGTFSDGSGRTGYDLALLALGQRISEQLAGAPASGDGLLPERWTSPNGIAFSRKLAGGRDFSSVEWSWRDPAACLVPLMFQTANEGGHYGAELAGFFDDITVDAGTPKAGGRFYDTETGQAARDVLLDGRSFGVSVDPGEDIEAEYDFECVEWDDDGFCIAGEESITFSRYEIAGMTMTPFPAFEDAQIMLEGSAPVRAASKPKGEPARVMMTLAEPKPGMPFLDKTGDDVLVEQVGRDGEVLAFATPLTITDPLDDGYRYVFGHAGWWGQCHTGNPWGAGFCAAASPSANGYRDFLASGTVKCDDGSEIPTGRLVVGCEHSDKMNAGDIRDHLAHAGMGWASVNIIDGEFGPWVCGVLDSTLTDEQVRLLRSLSMSGEWVGELGGILSVNASGFPVQREKIPASFGAGFVVPQMALRASVKGGKLTKLIGGNVVRQCAECAARRASRNGTTNGTDHVQMDRVVEMLNALDLRTRHLIPAAAEALRSS